MMPVRASTHRRVPAVGLMGTSFRRVPTTRYGNLGVSCSAIAPHERQDAEVQAILWIGDVLLHDIGPYQRYREAAAHTRVRSASGKVQTGDGYPR